MFAELGKYIFTNMGCKLLQMSDLKIANYKDSVIKSSENFRLAACQKQLSSQSVFESIFGKPWARIPILNLWLTEKIEKTSRILRLVYHRQPSNNPILFLLILFSDQINKIALMFQNNGWKKYLMKLKDRLWIC